VLAALAASVDELLSDAEGEIGDDIDLRIASQHYEIRVEVVRRDEPRRTDKLPSTVYVEPLTRAERSVLHYLATNLTLRLIAEQLCVSRNTVKTHSIAIYRKLGVSSRNAAVDAARELGLLTRFVALPTPEHAPRSTRTR
jgi:ATP/maltotriose-dependent transcriptional regulator MalT